MVIVHSSAPVVESPIRLPFDNRRLSHTQKVLYDLLCVVGNLHDNDDVQCMVFLAGEFGILHSSPFYFSRRLMEEKLAPWSLVLRDALRTLLDWKLVGWENGWLRSSPTNGMVDQSVHVSPDGVAWLSALSPGERAALAQSLLDTSRSGGSASAARVKASFHLPVEASGNIVHLQRSIA